MSNIELPRDAEGREIPLDTNTLYDADGDKREVQAFEFSVIHGTWKVQFVGNLLFLSTSSMHLTEPDSWAKLEEDLAKCVYAEKACLYYSKDGTCQDCELMGEDGPCTLKMFSNILERIRNLNGENHDC